MLPRSSSVLRVMAATALMMKVVGCMEPEFESNADSGCSEPVGTGGPGGPDVPDPRWRQIRPADATAPAFHAVWTSSHGYIFAVGDEGHVLQKIVDWEWVDSGVDQNLLAVSGTHPANVFAVGDAGAATHFDGVQWTATATGVTVPLRGVWATGSNEGAFAVGEGGTVIRYRNDAWAPMNSIVSTNLRAVSGSSASDVVAVGDGGTVLRYNGSAWRKVDARTTNNLNGVWVGPGGYIAVVGAQGTFIVQDGTGWRSIPTGSADVIAVSGTRYSDLHLATATGMMHFDGSHLTRFPLDTMSLVSVSAASQYSAFAVDEDGAIFQYYR